MLLMDERYDSTLNRALDNQSDAEQLQLRFHPWMVLCTTLAIFRESLP
jgi:hypothetical protein